MNTYRRKMIVLASTIAVISILVALFLRPVSVIRHKNFHVFVSYHSGDNILDLNDVAEQDQIKQILSDAVCRRRIEPVLWPAYTEDKLRYHITVYYPDTQDSMHIYLGLPDDPGEDSMMNKAYQGDSKLFNLCWRILEPETLMKQLDVLHLQ